MVLQGDSSPVIIGGEKLPEGGVLGVFEGMLAEEVACVDFIGADEVIAWDSFCEGFYRVEMAGDCRATVSFPLSSR